jgi:hypothetical protein
MSRTTVTLDPDVEQLLRDAMQARRLSFKQALNEAVRLGLAEGVREMAPQPYRVRARALGLRSGIDPARLNQLADELETETFRALDPRRPGSRGA